MNEEVEKQAIGRPDAVDDTRTPLVKFAHKMEEDWWTFEHTHGGNERVWAAKLTKPEGLEELKGMYEEITGLIKTCEDVLAVCPSPEGRNNIADDWADSLTRTREEIKELIDKKQ